MLKCVNGKSSKMTKKEIAEFETEMAEAAEMTHVSIEEKIAELEAELEALKERNSASTNTLSE